MHLRLFMHVVDLHEAADGGQSKRVLGLRFVDSSPEVSAAFHCEESSENDFLRNQKSKYS